MNSIQPAESPLAPRPSAPVPAAAARPGADEAAAGTRPLVPALTRALSLLDHLAAERQPLSLAQLAKNLGLPKSSVHGLCSTLLARAYLRRSSEGSYTLGPGVMNLADAFVAGTGVAQEFTALWQGGQSAPDDTVVLAILNDTDVVYVATRSGTQPLGLSFSIGMRLPAYLAASGKAMLAHLPEARVRALFAQHGLRAMAREQAPTLEELLAELAQVRQRGWSVDDESVREGVHCIGAPVFGAGGDVVAGVGMCRQKSLRNPDTREAQRRHVVDVAARLTQRLGGRAP